MLHLPLQSRQIFQNQAKGLRKYYEIIYPNEAADGPQRFAIVRRNKYIAEKAGVIVCYVSHSFGGAHKAVQTAKKWSKMIINLAQPASWRQLIFSSSRPIHKETK